MKINTTFLLFLCVVGVGAASYFAAITASENKRIQEVEEVQKKYDSIKNSSDFIEIKHAKRADSIEIENDLLKKYIKLTDKTINKILKQNEKNKTNLLVITDSVRLHIIDSLLRSGGYR